MSDKKEPDFEKLNQFLESLPSSISKAVGESITGAIQSARQQQTDDEDDDDFEDDDDEEDVDYESLTNKQLAEKIVSRVEKVFAKSLKPVITRVDTVSKETEADRFRREILEAKSKYADLPKWADELKANLSAHPGMSVEDAYLLARSKYPDKAREIDTEIAKTKEQEDAKNNNSYKRFGGLLPTSSIGSSKEGESKMTASEAADKAWAEAMAGVPEELIGTSG